MPDSAPPDSFANRVSTSGSQSRGPVPAAAEVVDLRRYRLARLIRDAGRQQGELARLMRDGARERNQLAEALQGAQRHLASIADNYKVLLVRLQREKDFRDACQEAAELEDLEEMIRRRDALAQELEAIRRTPRGIAGN
ncbi:hypothetical protein A6A40_11875 [Azospirillum humicireducens]|uniref:Uncharacterized protein n=1 Tax=Azospirillum humicireducens TaxID=1226968 RepID=A0A160JHJ3_9PROT|nr:hypothetical protein [Azospirillum humicireducens]ANC92538.1 hypothetical protein A6A40_11875 [Azospirillum humicireducens]